MLSRVRLLLAVAVGVLVLAACGMPAPPTKYDLTVTLAGAGTGTVVSDPAGIDVDKADAATATFAFAEGTEVVLTATPAAGSTFSGFTFPADATYDCEAGSATTTCVLTMDAAKSVTATFGVVVSDETLTVAIATAGGAAGTVTSAPTGIDTGADDFSAVFPIGDTVDLTAAASTGAFAGWTGGDCDGLKSATCTVTIGVGEPTVTANFNAVETLTVRVAAIGDDAVEFLGPSALDATDYPEGWVWADFLRLDLGKDPDHTWMEAGFRFPGVTVPAGAKIQSAVLQVTAYPEAMGSGAMDLTISGQAAAVPAIFPQDAVTAPSFDITGRARTTASVVWNVDGTWAGNTAYTAPDAAAVLQEIIGLPGWASGNPVALFVRADGVSDQNRRVYTFEGTADTDRHPTLVIEYVPLP